MIEVDILEGAKSFPVVAILGPRQSGKTTLAQSIFKNHVYISLEDFDLREAAQRDPRTFLMANRNEYGVIIDEFQYVPSLLSYIQTTVDREQKQGFFILTGSQNFLMNEAITQSLAGRVSLHTLLPLSVTELEQSKLLPAEIEPMLFKGSYPAIYAKNVEPERLYNGYMQTYIERDVRQLSAIGDLTTFRTFITLCAARVGQILNVTALGNDCGVSDHTVKRWLSILEASYIIFRLYPYHANLGKRLVKAPKLYFYDVGLVCYLLRIKEGELATHAQRGGIFESFVISEIMKSYYNRGKRPDIYYWRDKTGHEVDCILDEGSRLIPIEIKSGRTFNTRFVEGLQFWNELFAERCEGIAIKRSLGGYVVFAGSVQFGTASPQLVSWQSIDKIFS